MTEKPELSYCPQPSALTLFGSLKSKVPFSSIRKETETAERAMAEEVVQEGLEPGNLLRL